MTCVELYQKVSEGRQSHCLEVNEGTGCEGCPYYNRENIDYSIEENDRPCYKDLLLDENNIKMILLFNDASWNNK